ncbi:glycosyl transferase family 2 [Haloactinopolyspora alba]|uniref:4,4'-diaponeurosporenoate glycosyltransferase n=1 Tax=Haloactinopolyspora alba TaxID=648780 RepID=A0A2P8E5Q0_9ACTN|nr:glycosyltransferase family 2 protein [Haloactinopolyspora alba]PSL04747.1 glycosyl transferase family 2 [Haloactinopolyspora alba]
MTSIVVPAHNEERVLGRLLTALFADARPGELDVVVVANGCTDATAQVAAGFTGVRVLETPVPSKSAALRLGDEAATSFPRLYVDADVVLGAADVRALSEAVTRPGVLAAGPVRVLPMGGAEMRVRWYYDVWQRLPAVRDELFGRGVVAVGEAGHARLGGWRDVMSDDLMVTVAFGADERLVAPGARVVVHPPRTYADLMRRRVRAMTGNAELALGAPVAPGARPAPRTGLSDLARLAARRPASTPKVALFAATAALARLRARRAVREGDRTWLRDESSRT